MANYSLVINSRFRPFEYQELLAPALMATQAHQQLEESYADLATKSSIWDGLTEGSKRAHEIYQAYAKALEDEASRLATEGLNPASRRTMLNMRSRYARDITPIENAWKRREEQAKQQAEIMAKDPTHFFARTASTTPLDEYLANPSLDTLTQNYSGALLTQQVSYAAAALAKDARNDPNVRTELRRLLPYQYETIRRTGFDPETVRQAILNSPDANKILTGIVDTAMANSGMNDWNYISPEDKQRILTQARQYANQGLWSAVGQTQYGSVTDDAAKMAAEYNNAVNLAREKYKIEHPDTPDSGEPRRGWNFLETNGDLAAYKAMQDKFTTKEGGLKASYFGNAKNGNTFVNPIALYDEAAKKYPDIGKGSITASYSSPGAQAAHRTTEQGIAQKRANYLKEKYGVTILTPKEYQNLKDLGYTSKSTFNDFRNGYSRRINERASQWRHESVNLNETALKERGNTLRGYLGYLEDYDKWDGQAYLMAANGTKGEPVRELSDIGIKDKKALEKAELTDVFYSRQVPGMIHSQFGGAEIYVNPNAFGSNAAKVVREADALLRMNDAQLKSTISMMYGLKVDAFTAEQARDFVAQNATAKLRDVMRGYGKGRTTTDSHI